MRDEHNGGWQGCLNKLADFTDARGTAASLTVVGDSRSTYVRTVRMALAEKGLQYAYDPAAPHSPPVDAISPYGRVPVFSDGETGLFETSAIVRYIDETFEGTPILAPNARLRAQMEQWVSMINCHGYDAMVRRYVLQYVFPKGEGGAPDRKTIDAALPEIEQLLAILDKAYGKRNFLVGDTVTMADLFLAPIVVYLGMFPESKALLAKVPNSVAPTRPWRNGRASRRRCRSWVERPARNARRSIRGQGCGRFATAVLGARRGALPYGE